MICGYHVVNAGWHLCGSSPWTDDSVSWWWSMMKFFRHLNTIQEPRWHCCKHSAGNPTLHTRDIITYGKYGNQAGLSEIWNWKYSSPYRRFCNNLQLTKEKNVKNCRHTIKVYLNEVEPSIITGKKKLLISSTKSHWLTNDINKSFHLCVRLVQIYSFYDMLLFLL